MPVLSLSIWPRFSGNTSGPGFFIVPSSSSINGICCIMLHHGMMHLPHRKVKFELGLNLTDAKPHGTKKVHRSWMVLGILGTRLPSPCFPRGKLSCSFREKPRGPQVWCDAFDCLWSVEWVHLSMQRHAKRKQVEAHTLWVHSRTVIIACQYSKQKCATWVNQSLSLFVMACLIKRDDVKQVQTSNNIQKYVP